METINNIAFFFFFEKEKQIRSGQRLSIDLLTNLQRNNVIEWLVN